MAYLRWKKSPPRADGSTTHYAQAILSTRTPEGPRQKVLGQIASINSAKAKDPAEIRRFWADARKNLRLHEEGGLDTDAATILLEERIAALTKSRTQRSKKGKVTRKKRNTPERGKHTLNEAKRIIRKWQHDPDAVVRGLEPLHAAYVRERLKLKFAVQWNGRFKSLAGRCRPSRGLLELSPNHDWDKHPGEFENTVTHEYAHFIEGDLEGDRRDRHHGPIWKRLHINMGGNGKRCHSIRLKDGVKRHRQQRVWVRCENWCRAWNAGKSAATRWVRRHHCPDCHGTLVRTNSVGARKCGRANR